jgi:AcrR family transcriptional regulator
MSEKKVSKKELIIQAALRCFNEVGIEQAKIIDIAKYAEVNHSLVLYYFPNYDDLGRAVIESLITKLNDATVAAIEGDEGNADKLLEDYILSSFKLVNENRKEFTIWVHFYYKATHSDEYKELNQTIRNQGRERMQKILDACIEQNICRSLNDSEKKETVDFIMGLITGNLIVSMTEKEDRIEQLGELTAKTVRQYLKGM